MSNVVRFPGTGSNPIAVLREVDCETTNDDTVFVVKIDVRTGEAWVRSSDFTSRDIAQATAALNAHCVAHFLKNVE